MIEHKYRDRLREIRVADQGQRAIVQDKPFTVDTSCCHSVVFVWKDIFQNHDLHVVHANASSEQRCIFDDRVILAVAAIGQERFKWIAPTIRNSPLSLDH